MISEKQKRRSRANNIRSGSSQYKVDYLYKYRKLGKLKALKKYYKSLDSYKYRWKWLIRFKHFRELKLPLYLSFIRWIIVDFLRGVPKRKFGIFQFVALPGEGKTMSMVAHLERYREEMKKANLPYAIATNFSYKHNDFYISHWTDMVRISKECYKNHINCVIAIDEVHVTFDSTDWKNFPAEILAMLSFNRKYGLEFLCSSQIYERIPKKIRDIANYTVICKNIGHFNRLFRCYYFKKADYESQFEGKKKKANYIKEFIADDKMYSLYNTLEQIDMMTASAKKEKDLQQKAFEILFGNRSDENDTD